MHVALAAGTVIRTADGDFKVEDLSINAVLLDGQRVQSVKPTLPGRMAVVYEPGCLGRGFPTQRLYLPADAVLRKRPETAVEAGRWFAAGGPVDGSAIRFVRWPRRLALYTLRTESPWVCLAEGLEISSLPVPAGSGMVATAARVGFAGDPGAKFTISGLPIAPERPMGQGDLPVRLLADGQWAAFVGREIVDGDFVFHFRVHASAEILCIQSDAYLPVGTEDSEPDARRFGVAIVEIAVDGVSVVLDGDAFRHGFYEIEGEHPRRWRWTNGAGVLAIDAGTRTREITVRITDWHQLLVAQRI